jgi:hypothetical protein
MMNEFGPDTYAKLVNDVNGISIGNILNSHKNLIQQEPLNNNNNYRELISQDSYKQSESIVEYFEKKKKRVSFPDELIKDYSDPPKKWKPGAYSTVDLLESYCKACEKQKCKPSAKLTQQLKALQDLDGINGEKVNVLNLKSKTIFQFFYVFFSDLKFDIFEKQTKDSICSKWKHWKRSSSGFRSRPSTWMAHFLMATK